MKTKYKLTVILGIMTALVGLTTAFSGAGSGTSSDPYQISTCQQLQNMQNDLDASYELVNDVDCSDFTDYSSVGNDSYKFTGVLDGQGYTVENLTIDEGGSNDVGLIGALGSGGEVRDIGVVNADVNGSGSVGGLAGDNFYGSVSNSFSTGSVSGTDNVGGLVGNNDGSVSNSFSSGSVSGSVDVGGLVGYHGGSVSNSFSTGSVSGTDNVGGLVGGNSGDGSVSSSYSSVSVSGDSDVGGLVGYNRGSVSGSFSSGSVSGTDNVGGLVGRSGGSVSNSYWDTESSGQSSSAGGTGLTTSEMQGSIACENMDFDFENTWTPVSGDYPDLINFAGSEGLTCNSPPSASFTSNSPVLTSEDFGLDASSSSDPDGDSLTYEWDTNDDGVYEDKTGVNPSVSKSDNGSYSIGLKVSDGNGGNDTVSQMVQVNNRDPVADFGFSPSAPSVGESVSFDGGLSSDSDGSVQLFEWDWDGDGTYESAGENPSNSFGNSGDQTVELKVTDDDGSTNTTSKTVSVGAISLSVDWSSYSSSEDVDGFRIYYGVGSVDESNMVEVGSSADSTQISDNSWTTGDQVCVEVRPYNNNGEASSDSICKTLS